MLHIAESAISISVTVLTVLQFICIPCMRGMFHLYSLFYIENTEGDVSHATLCIINVNNGLQVDIREQAV